MKTTEISDAELRKAFAGFVDRLKSESSLQGEPLATYVRQASEAFEANLHRDSASVEGHRAFLLLRSTSHYVSYPGDDQVNLELAPDVDDARLGEAVVTVLRASTRMTLNSLTGAVQRLEREDGVSRYKTLVAGLCGRYGFKTKKALFKSMRMIHVDRQRSTGEIAFRPTDRFAVDGFQGLDGSQSVDVPAAASPEEIGAALRTVLARCVDTYGK